MTSVRRMAGLASLESLAVGEVRGRAGHRFLLGVPVPAFVTVRHHSPLVPVGASEGGLGAISGGSAKETRGAPCFRGSGCKSGCLGLTFAAGVACGVRGVLSRFSKRSGRAEILPSVDMTSVRGSLFSTGRASWIRGRGRSLRAFLGLRSVRQRLWPWLLTSSPCNTKCPV
ncbi:hypothetical protein BGW80DRAFT_141362 [Lactifluus volemus]|nr:hypothetical protein BGW80DRAFT_141362 [Lactifluus volemus]